MTNLSYDMDTRMQLTQTCGAFAEQVTGIYFESKVDYTTWFGTNVEYIHGIQVRNDTERFQVVQQDNRSANRL